MLSITDGAVIGHNDKQFEVYDSQDPHSPVNNSDFSSVSNPFRDGDNEQTSDEHPLSSRSQMALGCRRYTWPADSSSGASGNDPMSLGVVSASTDHTVDDGVHDRSIRHTPVSTCQWSSPQHSSVLGVPGTSLVRHPSGSDSEFIRKQRRKSAPIRPSLRQKALNSRDVNQFNSSTPAQSIPKSLEPLLDHFIPLPSITTDLEKRFIYFCMLLPGNGVILLTNDRSD